CVSYPSSTWSWLPGLTNSHGRFGRLVHTERHQSSPVRVRMAARWDPCATARERRTPPPTTAVRHMAPYESDDSTAGAGPLKGRGKASRYAVPVAVVGVAAATIGIVPALAASGDPDLPDISAQQLIEKIAASDVQQLSGTVKINTDL